MHARSANLHAGARSAPQKFLLILALVTIKKSGLQSLRTLNHAQLHITILTVESSLYYLEPQFGWQPTTFHRLLGDLMTSVSTEFLRLRYRTCCAV